MRKLNAGFIIFFVVAGFENQSHAVLTPAQRLQRKAEIDAQRLNRNHPIDPTAENKANYKDLEKYNAHAGLRAKAQKIYGDQCDSFPIGADCKKLEKEISFHSQKMAKHGLKSAAVAAEKAKTKALNQAVEQATQAHLKNPGHPESPLSPERQTTNQLEERIRTADSAYQEAHRFPSDQSPATLKGRNQATQELRDAHRAFEHHQFGLSGNPEELKIAESMRASGPQKPASILEAEKHTRGLFGPPESRLPAKNSDVRNEGRLHDYAAGAARQAERNEGGLRGPEDAGEAAKP
jgi:hypothetical protein